MYSVKIYREDILDEITLKFRKEGWMDGEER